MLRHVCLQLNNIKHCPKCGFAEGGSVPLPVNRIFYEDTFGLVPVYNSEELWRVGKQTLKIRVCKMAAPGQEETGPYLELVEGTWGAHVAFTVDEWPDNVNYIRPVRLDGHDGNGVEVRFCMDIAGNMIEVVRPKK